MQPDKTKDRKLPRDESEVAYFTKLLGRNPQRQLLQQQVEVDVTSGSGVAHGEESSSDSHSNPPQDDRAG